ncbi:GNAT family N-acetyltransferase [Mesobacillus zeae]|nr:GNAT family protein [Mesobacillus zeae]
MSAIFENEMIRLRDAVLNDAEELLHTNNDDEVMMYYGKNPYNQDIQGARDEILWFRSLLAENKGVRWVIADKASNQYIGDIGVFNFEPDHNRAELGFKLQKKYWNKGIMRVCIQQVLEFAFEEKSYNRIEALVDPRNIGCQKTLKKNGFQLEGALREYEFERGQYIDLQMYSILRREFSK